MVRSFPGMLGLALFLAAAPAAVRAQEGAATETRKIETLIQRVEGLKGATFIRNGKEYDAKTAAEFLRRKWQANQRKIRSAADFIEKVASISSTSGKPYRIRFADGKEVQSGTYLRAELKKLEKS